MKPILDNVFAGLLRSQYGTSASPALKRARRLRTLFANVHGQPVCHGRTPKTLSIVQSVRYDNSETMVPAPLVPAGEEYIVALSADVDTDEYVIEGAGTLAFQSSMYAEYLPFEADIAPVNKTQALEENRFDLLESAPNLTSTDTDLAAPAPALLEREEPQPAPAEISQTKATEDDFIADMQAILSGQKAFDPVSKQIVSKDQLDETRAGPAERPVPEAKSSQAIFDRIAQSMQYANAYDLGTVELANRFADFDRLSEIQKKVAADKKTNPSTPPPTGMPTGPKVDTADFIRDLDAIRQRPAPQGNEPMTAPVETPAAPGPAPLSEAADEVVKAPVPTA